MCVAMYVICEHACEKLGKKTQSKKQCSQGCAGSILRLNALLVQIPSEFEHLKVPLSKNISLKSTSSNLFLKHKLKK